MVKSNFDPASLRPPRIGKKRPLTVPIDAPIPPIGSSLFSAKQNGTPRVRSTSTLAIDRFARQPNRTRNSVSLSFLSSPIKRNLEKHWKFTDSDGRGPGEGNDRDDAQKQTPQTHRRHWQTWSLVGWRTGRGPSPPWFRGEERALRLAHNRELIPRVSDRPYSPLDSLESVSGISHLENVSPLCFPFSLSLQRKLRRRREYFY